MPTTTRPNSSATAEQAARSVRDAATTSIDQAYKVAEASISESQSVTDSVVARTRQLAGVATEQVLGTVTGSQRIAVDAGVQLTNSILAAQQRLAEAFVNVINPAG